jgi:hypothetical protein
MIHWLSSHLWFSIPATILALIYISGWLVLKVYLAKHIVDSENDFGKGFNAIFDFCFWWVILPFTYLAKAQEDWLDEQDAKKRTINSPS